MLHTYPYRPASVNVSRVRPRPMAAISATFSTLRGRDEEERYSTTRLLNLRILHGLSPLLHNWSPTLLKVRSLRDHIRSIETRELGVIRRLLAHFPEEATFRIRRMGSDVEWPLSRVEASNDVQAWLIHGALWLLSVLESDTDLTKPSQHLLRQHMCVDGIYLVSQRGTLILLQKLLRLSEVVFNQV